MLARLRFIQFDVPYDAIHHSDEGVPLPPHLEGWQPLNVEIRGTPRARGTPIDTIRLAVWLWAPDDTTPTM